MADPEHPTVSVVVPVYNGEATLPATLDSIAAQTYDGPIQTIVVDDGSTDASAEVARAHELDVRLIQQENTGVTLARRHGIGEADGEWIAFLDADDRWLPQKLERQVEAVDQPALCFTRYRRVRSDDEAADEPDHPAEDLQPTARELIRGGNFIGNSTAMVHRECLRAIDWYPEDTALNSGGQDYATWLRIAPDFPLVYVRGVLTKYGVHADNRIGTDPVAHFHGALNALEDFHRWDAKKFRRAAGCSFRRLVSLRTLLFIRDAVTRIGIWPADAVPRAISELAIRYGTSMLNSA